MQNKIKNATKCKTKIIKENIILIIIIIIINKNNNQRKILIWVKILNVTFNIKNTRDKNKKQ